MSDRLRAQPSLLHVQWRVASAYHETRAALDALRSTYHVTCGEGTTCQVCHSLRIAAATLEDAFNVLDKEGRS